MIETKEDLCNWRERAEHCPDQRFTLDLEADSLHRYHEKLCLIQYADKNGSILIDPLSIEDMTLFSDWLQKSEVWMHGADYDMVLFRRAFQCMPAMIWDTQIAARLIGLRKFGLANLVEHFFNITLSKTSQKADWSKRPLTEKMLEYAANDVHFMLPMAEMLVQELTSKGRYSWFVESCQEAMKRTLIREQEHATEEHWRIQGSGKLYSRGLAALKLLWTWRDQEASVWDRPAFMVCGNADLLSWSQSLQEHKSIKIPDRFPKGRRHRFEQTLETFHSLQSSEYPQKIKHPKRIRDDHFEARLLELMTKRDTNALELDLEPSLIASRAVLEDIASHPEIGIPHLMSWQRNILGL